MRLCSVEACGEKHYGKGFCKEHYGRMRRTGQLERINRKHGTGWYSKDGYMYHSFKLAHHIVAEKALGKPLPKGVHVHHIDGNKLNNHPTNLVICPGAAYHNLLHQRQRALEECGHADWRKCQYCKKYDAPENMYQPGYRGLVHRNCKLEYEHSSYMRRKGK